MPPRRFDVHIYAVTRALVPGVEAESMEEAIRVANRRAKLGDLFDTANTNPNVEDFGVSQTSYAEEDAYYLVDVAGDNERQESTWFSKDGKTRMDPSSSRTLPYHVMDDLSQQQYDKLVQYVCELLQPGIKIRLLETDETAGTVTAVGSVDDAPEERYQFRLDVINRRIASVLAMADSCELAEQVCGMRILSTGRER